MTIFDSPLGLDAFLVGVLNLPHLGDGIGQLNDCRMRVASRQDDMHHFRLLFQGLGDLGRVQHTVTDGVIDLVQHHQVPLAGKDGLARLVPRFFHHLDVRGIRLRTADFHEPAPHLLHDEVVAEGLHRVQLAVMPRALEELQHEHFHPLPDRAQGRAHGRGGLAFPRPGVDDDQSATNLCHC